MHVALSLIRTASDPSSSTSRTKALDGENSNNQPLEHLVNLSDTPSLYVGTSRQIGPNRREGFLISEPWLLPQTKT